ncbi:MAG TPA: TIR domain-containing protein [Acetobacteraceae bacterium]|nr:TIR domain-containing protein [Acetobacteraceae bacterium]
MSHDVFISYASSDRAPADQICLALESRGLRCWIAPRNVLPGEDWAMAILAAIAQARCMVVVLSAATGASVHVRNEVVTATSQRLPIVPVRVEDVQPGGALRLHLAGWHWLDAFPPPASGHAESLVAGVRAAFADSDATVNLAMRRPMPAGPTPRPETPAPPVQPASERQAESRPVSAPPSRPSLPNPAVPVAGARRSGLILAAVAGTMLVVLGLAAWYFGLGPGREWWAAAPPAAQQPGHATHIAAVAAVPEDPPPAPAPPVVPVVTPTPMPAPMPVPPPGLGPAVGDARPPAPRPAPAPAPASTPLQPRLLDEPGPRPAPPAGQVAFVAVVNASRQDVDQLYLVPAGESGWGADWLGMAQITPGNRVLLPRPAQAGCLFNLRVVYRDRSAEELRRHDLCAQAELRFDGTKARAAGAAR